MRPLTPPPLLLLLLLFAADALGSSVVRPAARRDPSHPSQSGEADEGSGSVMPIKSRGSFLGDFCTDQCNAGLQHTVCDPISLRCECEDKYPVVVDNNICAPSLKLGDACLYDQSCQYFDRNAECARSDDGDGDTHVCKCRPHYQPSITLESVLADSICIPEPHGPWLKSDVPTVIGLGVGMSLFMALTCLVLKLFSRARFAQARAYGNAHLPPPPSTAAAAAAAAATTHSSDGKHRQSYHRQMSVAESDSAADGAAQRRNNSITTNGGYHRTPGSFHGRRASSQSDAKSPMTRNHRESIGPVAGAATAATAAAVAQQEADPGASSPEHLEPPPHP